MRKIKFILLMIISLLLVGCQTKLSVERGNINEDVYTNSSIGITFTKPSNWRFYSDEEMADLLDVTAEMYKDENLFKVSKLTTIFDFMAINDSNGDNINLGVENLKASRNTRISVEKYIEIFKDNLNKNVQGSTYSFADTETKSLGDVEFVCLTADCSYSGVTMKQYIYIQKFGNCMVSITCTSTSGMNASQFEAMFS